MQRGCDLVSTVVGREKRGDGTSIHASGSWAVPGPFLLSCLAQREAWPTACAWHPGKQEHPPLSRLIPWERTHTAGGFSWCYSIKALALPKPVDWLPVASQEQIADTVVNAVTFLPQAIRLGTRTLLSFQGTTTLFSQRGKKVEIHERQGFKPQAPNHWDSSPVACDGLKPCNVM
jgi:hypothetical protein